jgi:Domain of unknown function (DUF4383)
MSSAAGRTAAVQSEGWTPARIFMLAAAVVHLPLGIAGLVYDQTFPVGATAAERASSELVFGIFETNGWHSLAALILGVITAYFAMYPRQARDAALIIGVLHVGIFAALVVSQPSTFWLASNDADQVVHASTAIGGIASALLTRPRESEAALSG